MKYREEVSDIDGDWPRTIVSCDLGGRINSFEDDGVSKKHENDACSECKLSAKKRCLELLDDSKMIGKEVFIYVKEDEVKKDRVC